MDALWIRLMNSDWHDHRGSGAREDRLGNDAWLKGFLGQAGWDLKRLPTTAERRQLRHLRVLLRRLMDAFRAGKPLLAKDIAVLNGLLEAAPICRQLRLGPDDTRLTVVPAACGMSRLVGEIAASFAQLLAEGEPARVKICANPDCGWVIYDESRNLSRRWCDAAECGNLIKVRQHRQRKREGRPS